MPNLQETPMVEHDSTQSVMQGLQTNATGIIFFPTTKFFSMQVSIFPIFYRWPLGFAYATFTRKYYSSTISFSFFLKLFPIINFFKKQKISIPSSCCSTFGPVCIFLVFCRLGAGKKLLRVHTHIHRSPK